MQILEKVHSRVDKTVKFVIKLDDDKISEVAYIDKSDGKDILCVSCQTACAMGCKFCHTTDCRELLEVRNLWGKEMFEMVKLAYDDLELRGNYRTLLVSFMGCGEPVMNYDAVVRSMYYVRDIHADSRFAVASMLPRYFWKSYFLMLDLIQANNLDVKIHLSLHFPHDQIRKEWMPQALEIKPSIAALEFWKSIGGAVEIHYAMIDGVNDSLQHAAALGNLIEGRDLPVKLIKYNERKTIEYHPSPRVAEFMKHLDLFGASVEYYEPPGVTIGASCGQLLMEYYKKYNAKA